MADEDGQNRRIGKKVNGALVEGFLYRNQLQPAAWLNSDGTVKARFIYGGKPNVPEYMVTSAGATYRLVTDRLGSPRVVVDMSSGFAWGKLRHTEFDMLLRIFQNPAEDPRLRGQIAEALGPRVQYHPHGRPRKRDEAARVAFLRGLKDPSPVVRFWSIFGVDPVS